MLHFLTLGANGKTLICLVVVRVYYERLGHILKPPVPKFRPDLSTRFKDIAEKQIPAKPKPTVVFYVPWCYNQM